MEKEAQTNYANPLATKICVGCRETDRDLRQFQCGCFWCRGCLKRYLEMKLAEKYPWPPMCCRFALGDQDVEWTQSGEILEEYRKIDREKREPQPLFCSQEQCSALLNTQNAIEGSNVVVCDKCETKTCQKCEQGHEPTESECKGPPIDDSLEALTRRKGWQKCSQCNRTIERAGGCKHMICRCGHQFCYSCGSAWGTCTCQNTFNIGNALLEVEPGSSRPGLEIRQQEILRISREQLLQRRLMRRTNLQRNPQEIEQRQKENQHPEQRHDHGPSTSSPTIHRPIGVLLGQLQYLPFRQRPEPLIGNPLHVLPALRPMPVFAPARQTSEAITMETPIRQPIAPTTDRRPFAAYGGNLSQIHDSLLIGESTPAEPESQQEPAPQHEAVEPRRPCTPPSQLSPSTPSSPPPWYPRLY
ncbi:hypothetical protein F4814DRAFT_458774 [Daldinia grandis]|nr:hypothetical protein F4814DRAFT_458774 [Daldinia grandis]